MVEIDKSLIGKEVLEMAFDRCIKCSTCKYSYKDYEKSCPSGEYSNRIGHQVESE